MTERLVAVQLPDNLAYRAAGIKAASRGMAVAGFRVVTRRDVAHRLIDFLEAHALEPVLGAAPLAYPEARRGTLLEVQEETRRLRARLRAHASAPEIYRTFHEELASPSAARLERCLRELDLPALEDVRIDFEQLASDLGIGTSGTL